MGHKHKSDLDSRQCWKIPHCSMLVFKTLGNYSSLTMHDIEQCGTFQHCPRSELCLRPILMMIQPTMQPQSNKNCGWNTTMVTPLAYALAVKISILKRPSTQQQLK